MTRHPVRGSEVSAPAGARHVGACDPSERFEVVLLLRRQAQPDFRDLVDRLAAGDAAVAPVTREAYGQRFGASAADVQRVTRFAEAHGLSVSHADPVARRVVLSGTVRHYNEAFGVDLQHFEHQAGTIKSRFRQPAGPVHLPDDVHEVVVAVLGLDNRAKARPHFRLGASPGSRSAPASSSSSADAAIRPPIRAARLIAESSFTPLQVATFYDFPAGDGAGQCIGLIELGGGYEAADLAAYFESLGVPQPRVEAVSVDGASNTPSGDPGGPDGEVTLDVEIVGALAPAALIAVYFTPNTEAGFVDALSAALHDTTRRPSVVSISWGAPESTWSEQTLNALNDTLQTAVALGVTVCVASGDSGSSDGVGDGADHVDFPASSPYALGCGGTHLSASGGRIASETVWGEAAEGDDGASGGGVSTVFALPAWQNGLAVARSGGGTQPLTKRGVPDVAGDADPASGYAVRIDGTDTVVGGTSAVAPLWAALIARINAARGKPVGFVNAVLYQQQGAFNDITSGSNGDFDAAPGWDACTGLGSPDGARVAAALGGG
ncbi:peptidase S53 [Burkholderia sp. WAC0059]|uniref:S53 family peptidase n=1 Tax=Burkholderia sp. WAC0059 TaxID=2066022 RepID=UPI000C7E869C|nr:S53 family peptidase [Burkholderia sp. WAC0059]PLZ04271.1 peptidase S53 [Burkholderia sp. WAC0059]